MESKTRLLVKSRYFRVVFVAVLYYLAGKLSLPLAITPEFGSPIWPAAGIALGAVVVFGGEMLIAVFLGALLLNGASMFSVSAGEWGPTAITAVSIGIGATLQAFVGSRLIKQGVSPPIVLEKHIDIVRFVILGAMSCVVSASFGVLGLFLAGTIQAEFLERTWITWAIGDAIGVVIVAPIFILCLKPGVEVPKLRKMTITLPVSIVLGLVLMSLLVVKTWDARWQLGQLEKNANELTGLLSSKVGEYVASVESVESFFLASDFVSAKEFNIFTTTLLKRFSGIQALEWIPLVSHDDRTRFIKEEQKRVPGFEIWQLDGAGKKISVQNRRVYFPVTYVEPIEENEAVIGFDLASDSARLEAIRQAIRRDEPQATRPIHLVQIDRKNEQGFLVVHSIRRAQRVEGVALGVFRFPEVLKSIKELAEKRYITFSFFDAENLDAPVYSMDASGQNPKLVVDRYVQIANRGYVIRFSDRRTSYMALGREWQTWMIMISVFALTSLFQILMLVISGRQREIQNEVRRKTADLKTAMEELARSNQDLEQFANVAAHDLQEPLHTIAGFATLIQSSADTISAAERAEYLDHIYRSTEHLQSLIKDLHTYSHLGRDKVVISSVDLKTVLESVEKLLKARIRASEAILSVQDELPVVLGNETVLVQVFQNLIGNGIKYQEKESIPKIEVSAKTKDGWCTVSVRDNGIGIDNRFLDHVFEPFKRLHGQGDYQGTGVGLAICKRVIERLGGEIWVESTPGLGSEFFIKLKVE